MRFRGIAWCRGRRLRPGGATACAAAQGVPQALAQRVREEEEGRGKAAREVAPREAARCEGETKYPLEPSALHPAWRVAPLSGDHVEASFRITKDELAVRPIWHRWDERIQAHILVCFLAYVLWKTLRQ